MSSKNYQRNKIYYLHKIDLLVIHFVVIDEHFSELKKTDDVEQRGIKSPSGLLSALGEPKQTFDGRDLYHDILSKAAALIRSLAQNHPFHDGNKRTAVIATIVFLESNGYRVIADEEKMYRLAMTIVKKKPTPSIDRIVRSLKKFTVISERKPEPLYTRYKEKILNWLVGKIQEGEDVWN